MTPKTTIETTRFLLVTHGNPAAPIALQLVRKADRAAVLLCEEGGDIADAQEELASLEWCFPTNPLDWRLEQLFRSYYISPAERARELRAAKGVSK